MKRIRLTDDQLQRVIELRESGHSFLSIERQTGITRRVAQRAYDEWRQRRSADELKDLRSEIALEEFREHLKTLTEVAEVLVDRLQSKAAMPDVTNADKYIEKIWESPLVSVDNNQFKSKPSRIARQNQMRFSALVEHTHDDVRWTALEDWKAAWNDIGPILDQLRNSFMTVLPETIGTFVSTNTDSGGQNTNTPTAEMIADKVLRILWELVIRDDVDVDSLGWEVREGQADNEFILIESTTRTRLIDNVSHEDAVMVRESCEQLVARTCQDQKTAQLREKVNALNAAASVLEIALDPLVLRPIIIRTRCNLCPI